jgi:hypothetical protein
MTEDSIFIDGGFDPKWYENKVSGTGMPIISHARKNKCITHKPIDLPYNKWHDWADEMSKKGIKQSQCDICKHWFFPEEL